MDLIAGFTEFFEFYEAQEYNQAWGATLPYEQNSSHNAVDFFEKHYNILYDGLKGVSSTHLSRRHSQNISPSVMTFPLEFKTLKPALKVLLRHCLKITLTSSNQFSAGFISRVLCKKA